ncbi:MAG: hypothetical protein JWQ62_2626 [Lacunisphaera sp.]|nr:hypothetical protein [Lacunisphaera sp.]
MQPLVPGELLNHARQVHAGPEQTDECFAEGMDADGAGELNPYLAPYSLTALLSH